MTTYVPFQPTPAGAFTFLAELDGQHYTMSVPWNVFGQRWYLRCTGVNGVDVFSALPLIGSPAQGNINLIAPYFAASTLVFRQDTQQFEINP